MISAKEFEVLDDIITVSTSFDLIQNLYIVTVCVEEKFNPIEKYCRLSFCYFI